MASADTTILKHIHPTFDLYDLTILDGNGKEVYHAEKVSLKYAAAKMEEYQYVTWRKTDDKDTGVKANV